MMDSIVGDSVAEGSKMQDVIEARSAINEVFSEAHDDVMMDKERRESKRMLHDVLEL